MWVNLLGGSRPARQCRGDPVSFIQKQMNCLWQEQGEATSFIGKGFRVGDINISQFIQKAV